MIDVSPESHGVEYHAAGVALCRTLRRNLWPFRADPAVARTLGLTPATAPRTTGDNRDDTEEAA